MRRKCTEEETWKDQKRTSTESTADTSSLLGGFSSSNGLATSDFHLRLLGEKTATPGLAGFLVLVVVNSTDGSGELGKIVGIFSANFSDGQNGGSLLVNDSAEASATIDNAVRDVELVAESGDPANELRTNGRKGYDTGNCDVGSESLAQASLKTAVKWMPATVVGTKANTQMNKASNRGNTGWSWEDFMSLTGSAKVQRCIESAGSLGIERNRS